MKQFVRWLLHHRIYPIIFFIVIVIISLVVTGFIVWGNREWASYKVTYTSWRSTIRDSTNKTFQLPASNDKERSTKIEMIKNLSKTIIEKNDICRFNTPLLNWQQSFNPDIKSSRQVCYHTTNAILAFDTKVKVVIDYLEDEKAAAKLVSLDIISSSDKLTEQTWTKQASSWSTMLVSLSKLKVSTAFSPVKQKLAEKGESIKLAWNNLIVANKAKDKAQYMDAQGKLAEVYGSLNDVNTLDTQQFNLLVSSLQSEYNSAFRD